MNIWDLIVKISGNGQGLRDDIDKDIASLEELNATELKDKNAIVDLDTAEASIKLDALNGKMSELENAMANVTLDDTGAQLKLDALKAELKSLKDARVTAKLSDEGFKLKLDDLHVRFAELRDKTVAVKVDSAGATVGIDTIKTELDTLPEEKRVAIRLVDFIMPQVEIAKTELDDIPDEKTIDIKVYDAEIIPETSLVRAELDDLPSHKVIGIEFKTDGYEKAKAEEESLDNGNGGSGFFSWLHRRNGGSGGNRKLGRAGMIGAVIAALAPAASPLGAAALGGSMGLLSAAAPGVAGTAGLAAVSISNLKPIFSALSQYNTNMKAASQATTIKQQNADIAKAELAWKGLNSAQMQAVHSLQSFESFWKSFSTSFQNPVLTMFSNGLKLLQNLLTDMKPAITGAASAFNTLLQDASKALNSPFWKSFFNWMGANAKQSVLAFGTSLGNLTKGFAGLLQAFSPMAKEMDAGWVKMTASFAKWATHLSGTRQFEDFLNYASKSGAAVLKLIGNLSRLVGTLLKDFAPLGLAMVKFVSDLTKFINQLLKTNPIVKILVDLLLGGLKNILQFVDGIIKFLTWLGKAHPIIMDIITAVGLLVAAFLLPISPMIAIVAGIAAVIAGGVELVKHWGTVKQDAHQVWDSITQFFAKTWKSITSGLKTAWNAIVGFFKKYGLDILAALTGPVGELALYLYKHWGTISSDAKKAWTTLKSDLHSWATGAKKAVTDVFDGLASYFSGLWHQAETWGSNLIHMLTQGIRNGLNEVKNAGGAVAKVIANMLGWHSPTKEGPGADSDTWAPNLMNMLTNGIKHGAPKLQDALNSALSMPQWAVSSGVASMVQGGGLTVNHIHSGSLQHELNGSFNVQKFGPQAIKHIEQQIYRNGVARGVK